MKNFLKKEKYFEKRKNKFFEEKKWRHLVAF